MEQQPVEACMSTFCNVENKPYDDGCFVETIDGITIHVKTTTTGHTLDGWGATFEAVLANGRWTLKTGDVPNITPPVIHDMTERELS